MSITLYPVATDFKIFETVWRNGTPARLAPEARDLIKATAAQVQLAATSDGLVYGINTGFGQLASVRISPHAYAHTLSLFLKI